MKFWVYNVSHVGESDEFEAPIFRLFTSENYRENDVLNITSFWCEDVWVWAFSNDMNILHFQQTKLTECHQMDQLIKLRGKCTSHSICTNRKINTPNHRWIQLKTTNTLGRWSLQTLKCTCWFNSIWNTIHDKILNCTDFRTNKSKQIKNIKTSIHAENIEVSSIVWLISWHRPNKKKTHICVS